MIKAVLLVGFGGAIGSIFRYLSNMWVARHFLHIFPLATLLVNIIGCLLIGLLVGIFEKNQLNSRELQYLFITGFCGGFTTFSAFALENVLLLQSHTALAFLYTALSIVVGVGAVWLGLYLSQLFY
jgi:CrcB protein